MAGERTGSTRISWASCALIASRALQTWQMKPVWLVNNRMMESSQKPSSRRRFCISGLAHNCRMRTATPALTRLNGQMAQEDASDGFEPVEVIVLISAT